MLLRDGPSGVRPRSMKKGEDERLRVYAMTKQNYLLIVMACLLNLSVAASSMADDVKEDNARNCIQTRTLKGTAVVDDRNVLFIKKGNSIYHNLLPRECKGLSRYKQFSYTTTAGSLCNLDTIRVVDGQGRESRSCRLGYFYTITTEELRILVEKSRRPPEPDSQLPDHEEEINKAEETATESDQPRR